MSTLPRGVYHIINVKSNTFLDLSGSDPTHTTVIGWDNGSDNQKWYISSDRDNDLYVVQNVHYGKYLYFSGALRENAPAVGVNEEQLWNIRPVKDDRAVFRFFIPRTPFNFELSNDGSNKDGTPVVLALQRAVKEQTWRIVAVEN
ncbi:ricin B lectin domain-containing protein [Amanita rubescens]|nr:ricin B lectin domain-containing protein [Amanita rubescens]